MRVKIHYVVIANQSESSAFLTFRELNMSLGNRSRIERILIGVKCSLARILTTRNGSEFLLRRLANFSDISTFFFFLPSSFSGDVHHQTKLNTLQPFSERTEYKLNCICCVLQFSFTWLHLQKGSFRRRPSNP